VAVSVVDIQVNSQGAVRNLRQLDAASKNTESALSKLDGVFGSLAASFAAGFAINKIISDVKELDTNIRRLGTVGGNVAALDKGLGALSDRLGGVANKAELAAASYQALSAGFSETGANLRVVEAATKAAVGGLVDVTAATEVTTKVLNAYNMSGDQATKVTDSIAKSIEYGVIQWSDYTSQLGRVASVSAIAGVSLDEVNAFISSATKNSATAEIAFTGLGATLSNMLKPTKESADAAKALGINWNLSGIRGEGFESLMGKLGKAMQENPVLANKMVGGQEAVRGAFAAAAKGGKDYAMILEGLGGAAGKTDADFQTMKGSLENTLKALDTSFKNLSEALGTAFGPTVVIAVQDITKAVNGFADFMATVPQPVMNTAGELVKLIAQMVLLKKAIDAIIGLRLAFIGAMTGMAGAAAASGAAATTSAGAFALYTNNTRTLEAAAISATGATSGLAIALSRLAALGIITVGINYVITQTGAISANIGAINKSEAAGTTKALTAQLKGKSAADRKIMLATAKKNLQNDQKLKQQLELQIKAQEAASTDKPDPSQRTDLLAVQARINTNQQRIKAIQTFKIDTPKPKPIPTPTPTPPPTPTGGTKPKTEKKPKDFTEQIANSKTALNLANLQFAVEGKILEARRLTNEPLVLALTAQKEIYKIDADMAKIKADKEMPAAQKLNEIAALEVQRKTINRQLTYDIATAEQTASQTRLQAITAYLEKQYELNTAIQQQNALAESVSSTLGQGMTSVFDALIQGSDNWGKSLQQIASKVLVDIANQLIRIYVIEQAVSAIKSFLSPALPFGGGGGQIGGVGTLGPNYGIKQFAAGGTPPVGRPSLVGERGPELFMPGVRGSIIPNNALGGGGGGVSVGAINISVQNTGDSLSPAAQKQIAGQVQGIVMATLVDQRRSGGVLR
jgi:TP901 family phage tail tape measure protein